MKKIKNVTLLNTISSLLLQIITIISGFIIPKIILEYFGSEVNGLVSSLNQFLGYIALMEGGVTGVVMANLYKPLYERNYEKISSIIKTTDKFFHKIAIIFVVYTLIIAFIYPLVFSTGFSYFYVITLTLILALNLLIQYSFSLTLRTLLNADKKVYIVSFTQIIVIIANIVLAIISIKIYPSIHILKLFTGLLYLLQPIIYRYYIKKYFEIDKNAVEDKTLLKSRWDGFAINIAAFIHFSTDITILTAFTDLNTVSIYSVYSLVTNGLRQLISAVSSGISPTIGHLYAKGNDEELKNKFEIYEYIIFILVFGLFTVAGLLITPFVMLYTNNISDTNYYQPVFGILLIISEALYLIKFPHLSLAYNANKFKELTIPSYIEAGINIVISLILVGKFGLIGISIGTLIGMLYRMIFQIYFTSKAININQIEFYKKLITFLLVTLLGVMICIFVIPAVEYTVINWIIHGVIYTIIIFSLYLIMSWIFYKEELKFIKKILKLERKKI